MNQLRENPGRAGVALKLVMHLPVEKSLLVVKVGLVVSWLRKGAKDLRASCSRSATVNQQSRLIRMDAIVQEH
jgi:hypothetical protein